MTYSIKFRDSSVCNSLADNTTCITNYSKEFKEPEICIQAIDSQSCLENMVPIVGVQACNMMKSENVEDCKKNYLVAQTISSFLSVRNSPLHPCSNEALREPGKFACYLNTLNLNGISTNELLTWKVNSEYLVCNSSFQEIQNPTEYEHTLWLQEKDKRDNFCMAAIAVYSNDLSLCDKAGDERLECYFSLALTSDLVTLETCNKLETIVIPQCYAFVAARTFDTSICTLPQMKEYGEQNCYATIKNHLHSLSIGREDCKMGIYSGKCWDQLVELGLPFCDSIELPAGKFFCIKEYKEWRGIP